MASVSSSPLYKSHRKEQVLICSSVPTSRWLCASVSDMGTTTKIQLWVLNVQSETLEQDAPHFFSELSDKTAAPLGGHIGGLQHFWLYSLKYKMALSLLSPVSLSLFSFYVINVSMFSWMNQTLNHEFATTWRDWECVFSRHLTTAQKNLFFLFRE